jgi:hypothetical protein
MGSWPGGIAAITLFVEDLEAASDFYGCTDGELPESRRPRVATSRSEASGVTTPPFVVRIER